MAPRKRLRRPGLREARGVIGGLIGVDPEKVKGLRKVRGTNRGDIYRYRHGKRTLELRPHPRTGIGGEIRYQVFDGERPIIEL